MQAILRLPPEVLSARGYQEPVPMIIVRNQLSYQIEQHRRSQGGWPSY